LRRPLRVAVLLLASLAGGCIETASGPEDRVWAALESFFATCARQNSEAGLRLLTRLAREPFLAADSPADACNRLLGFEARVSDAASFYGETEVEGVHVDGDVADATVVSPEGDETVVELENVGGLWRVGGPA
jgi:hypothetical protein